MNATDLLANTLSAGMLPHERVSHISLYLQSLSDANTRQDATEKLDIASRENYVRPLLFPPL
jgi:hypothetical protein